MKKFEFFLEKICIIGNFVCYDLHFFLYISVGTGEVKMMAIAIICSK